MKDRKLSQREAITLIIAAIVLVGSGLVIGWRFDYRGFDPFAPKTELSLGDVDSAYNLIQSYYFQSADTGKLAGSAIDGLVQGLNDRYSFYLPADAYGKVQAQEANQLSDIGVLFVTRNKQALILEVYPGTPADQADIVPGDIITKIDGTDTALLTGALPISTALLGKDGEPVTVTVLKQSGAQKNITIVRKAYTIPTVTFKTLGNGIGYLKIYSFDKTLNNDWGTVEKSIVASGVNKLVVDLRNNPGGDVDTAIMMIDKFVNDGVIFSEKIGKGFRPARYAAAGNAPFKNMQVALVVNNLTASAAEIFTAALQQNHRGVVVGGTTEGKATEQTYFTLKDGSAIHLTIGTWFTPNGSWINGIGITPDIKVADTGASPNASLAAAEASLNK